MSQSFPFMWTLILTMSITMMMLFIMENIKMKNKKMIMKNKKMYNTW